MIMSPFEFVLSLFGICLVAGFFGSLVGVGGWHYRRSRPHVDLRNRYPLCHWGLDRLGNRHFQRGRGGVRAEGMTNLRTAMLLEIGTTTGAISGAFLAGILHGPWLYVIFGGMLAASAVTMLLRLHDSNRPVPPDVWADRFQLRCWAASQSA